MRENAEKCSPQEAAMVPLQAQGGAGSGPLRAALCPPPPPRRDSFFPKLVPNLHASQREAGAEEA